MANPTLARDKSAVPSPGIFSREEVKDVSRSVSIATQNLLWGRVAGRCEFAGCNKPLWKPLVTSGRTEAEAEVASS